MILNHKIVNVLLIDEFDIGKKKATIFLLFYTLIKSIQAHRIMIMLEQLLGLNEEESLAW